MQSWVENKQLDWKFKKCVFYVFTAAQFVDLDRGEM